MDIRRQPDPSIDRTIDHTNEPHDQPKEPRPDPDQAPRPQGAVRLIFDWLKNISKPSTKKRSDWIL
jgi:hypothetical protein